MYSSCEPEAYFKANEVTDSEPMVARVIARIRLTLLDAINVLVCVNLVALNCSIRSVGGPCYCKIK